MMLFYMYDIALVLMECYQIRKRGRFIMNTFERQKDILSIIEKLDISPTLFKNATEKYKALAKYLNDNGLEADMYPQGSFAIGTVVRPNVKNPDANYDLDFICQVRGTRDDYSPSKLRDLIEEKLSSSDLYGGKLETYPECFTIEYAAINGVGFSIDIVPAAEENAENKKRLREKCNYPELIEDSISIPKQNSEKNYCWLTNNPKGFRTWFDSINAPFIEASKNDFRNRFFQNNRTIFASVEEIPNDLYRSALQRVIQILKYHMNVYYFNLPNGDDVKPISAIINVLAARIASGYDPYVTVFDLLEYVLGELSICAQQQDLEYKNYIQNYGERKYLSRADGKWNIPNPANPEDNLADRWNKDAKIPYYFFHWLKAVRKDLIDSLNVEDEQVFRTALENGFGEKTVSSVLGKKYCNDNKKPKPIVVERAAKPYGSL